MRQYLPTALYLAMALTGCQAALPPTQPAQPEQGRAIALTIAPPAARQLQAMVSRWSPSDLDHYTVSLLMDNPNTGEVDYEAVAGVSGVDAVEVSAAGGGFARFEHLASRRYRVEVRGYNDADIQITTVATSDVDLSFTGTDVEQVQNVSVPTTLATTFNGEMVLPTGAALPSWATSAEAVVRENGQERARLTYQAGTPTSVSNLKAGHTYEVTVTALGSEHEPSTATATYTTDASLMTLEQVQTPSFNFGYSLKVNATVGDTPYGVTAGLAGTDKSIWVTNNAAGTVSHLTSTGGLISTITVGSSPWGIAAGADGSAWVANSGSNSVSHLSSDGSIATTADVPGAPCTLAVAADGSVWVTRQGDNKVSHLSSTGSFIGEYDTGGAPIGIGIAPNGDVWVTNYGSDTVTVLSSDGTAKTPLIAGDEPYAVDFAPDGTAWVVNRGGNTVLRFASNGTPLGTEIIVSSPVGVRVMSDGTAWISSEGVHEVRRYDSDGTQLDAVPVAGATWITCHGENDSLWTVIPQLNKVLQLAP